MKFTIDLATLKRALATAAAITDKRGTMAILENVLVKAGSDTVKLTASDLEVSSIGSYPAKVAKQGAITIPARKFSEAVRALAAEDDAEVAITARDNRGIEVACGVVKFQITGMAADEFPRLAEINPEHWFDFDPATLAAMIQRTAFAAAPENDGRPILHSVHFEPGGGDVLKLAATDGYRLALTEAAFPASRGFGLDGEGITLPLTGIVEAGRRLTACKDTAAFARAGAHAAFRIGGVELRMRLLEGRFPDCAQVIPVDNDRKAKVPLTRFLAALRHVAPFATGRIGSVKLEFAKGKLVLSSQDPEIGMARDEFEIDFDGDEIAVGFNPRYLVDALTAMKGAESVVLELADDLSPAVIRPEGEATYLCVVVPMRI